MQNKFKAVNLPEIGHSFSHNDVLWHTSTSNDGKIILWKQDKYSCVLCNVYSNLEECMLSYFNPEDLMYRGMKVFLKKTIPVQAGQIYTKNHFKWLIIQDNGKMSLVSIPEFFVQSNYDKLSKEEMENKLEENKFILTTEKFW